MGKCLLPRKGSKVAKISYPNHFSKSYIEKLSQSRYFLSSGNVTDYAIFAGGCNESGGTSYNTVDAYNNSFTRTTASTLTTTTDNFASASNGTYSVFAGGSTYKSTVNAFSNNLTRSTLSNLSEGRHSLAGASINGNFLFAGGKPSANSYSSDVDVYNSNLVKSTSLSLLDRKAFLASTSLGNYALFGGGVQFENNTAFFSSTVDAFNQNLVMAFADDLSLPRGYFSASSSPNYALFGGGTGDGEELSDEELSDVVDVYDSNLTRVSTARLSEKRYYLCSSSINGYVLFAGGINSSINRSYTVDAFNDDLINVDCPNLKYSRESFASSTLSSNHYALFAGGTYADDETEVYTDKMDVVLYPNSKYKFNGMQSEQTSNSYQTLSLNLPGYVKVVNANI